MPSCMITDEHESGVMHVLLLGFMSIMGKNITDALPGDDPGVQTASFLIMQVWELQT